MTQQEKEQWLKDHPGESLPPADPNLQDPASKPDPTSEELAQATKKIAELETQILQAGHVIETLKKDKKLPDPPADEELENKIKESVEKILQDRLPDSRLAEAEEQARKLTAERDELILTLGSKRNRSTVPGDSGQRQPIKVDLTLSPAEERFTRPPYSMTPEEIINNRE